MKIKLISASVLFLVYFLYSGFGQIPNNGFESWGTIIDTCSNDITVFDNPNGWRGSFQKPCTPPYSYSIEKNIDNYPLGTGSFSIKIKSDVAKEMRGLAAVVANNQAAMAPAFPISGHPTSLTGYYKFSPLNGDTMNIIIVLFQNGAMVAGGVYKKTETVSNWTSFNIPISPYSNADSAVIFLASYNLSGGSLPLGNSVLYVDNLNFDNLITGITEINDSENNISIYPNPCYLETKLQTKRVLEDATLTICNSIGQKVKQITNISGQTITLSRDNLKSGLYFVFITEKNNTILFDKLMIAD